MTTKSEQKRSSDTIAANIPIIEEFESIDALPIVRHHLFNQFILQAVGVGSTMEDVQARLQKMDEFLASKIYDQANVERRNLQVTFYSMLEGLNYHHLAYACLIKKIDGVDYTYAMTESEILQIYEKLKKVWITNQEILEANKKKRQRSIENLLPIFLRGLETT